jgi:RNA polymerase-interacting CarD/CdnL/TRCF family regulator
MNGTGKPSFKEGQKVIHPNHGVMVLEKIENTPDGDEYYLKFPGHSATIFIPAVTKNVLRPLSNPQEFEDALQYVRAGRPANIPREWKKRQEWILQKMKNGDVHDWAEVLRVLCVLSWDGTLTQLDKAALQRAKSYFIDEGAEINRGKDGSISEAQEKIFKVVEECFRRRDIN